MVALFAARPWSADWKTCELVSPSAGMLVWTSSTSGSASRIVSAWIVRLRTAAEVAPVGGETVTIRVASDPALMNCVGRSGARAADAKNRIAATATTPSFVARPRRTKVIAGVYIRTQNERVGSPVSSVAVRTSRIRKKARTGTTVRAQTRDARSAKVTV